MAKKFAKPSSSVPGSHFILVNFPTRTKIIFLALMGFLFYANTLLNKYAFDDNFNILKNEYVQKGFSGIPKILSHDSYASFYSGMGSDPSGLLSAGRYRPLSLITFAIEQQFFGNSELLPSFRHLVNVLAYILCTIAIFIFLDQYLLKKIASGKDIAFLSTFLFLIHPIHTEVVANIKSLDEILSLLFSMLTFIYSLKFMQNKKVSSLLIGVGFFLLALLSKEYAVMLVFFIPLLFYLLENKKFPAVLRASIPYYLIFLVYLALRYKAVGFHFSFQGTNLLSNPYFYASHIQKIATEWFVLGKYIVLLIFPYPLSSDYSYSQIPYHNFSDISVIFSILIYLGILAWGVMLIRKKSILSFAVFFFLLNIFMISNFLLNIGATMGERLVFHSSLGFAIVLGYYFQKFIVKIPFKTRKKTVLATLSLISVICFGETVNRNSQWKDDTILFIHDVGVVPNSFLVNNNAGSGYLGYAERKENTVEKTRSDLDSAHKYLIKAYHLNPDYTNTLLNLGGVYLQEDMPDSTKYCLDRVAELHPDNPALKSHYGILARYYLVKGFDFGKNGDLITCIKYMKTAIEIDSVNSDIWYNLGVAYYGSGQYDSAKYAWTKTLQFSTDSNDVINAERGLQELETKNNKQ